MSLIEDLKWRYAAKKYDTTKKISDEDLETLQEAIQLTATSYGLQLFNVINVEDAETRKALQPASWGQSQIVDASHLFVFAIPTEVTGEMIEGFAKLMADTRGIPVEALDGMVDFMKGKIGAFTKEQQQVWLSKQTYIALGNVMAMAAELKIDGTPMEGFEPNIYDEILDLKNQGLTSTVVMALGYRSEEDDNQNAKKVRRPISELFLVK